MSEPTWRDLWRRFVRLLSALPDFCPECYARTAHGVRVEHDRETFSHRVHRWETCIDCGAKCRETVSDWRRPPMKK